jgi:TatD DNase family protein
MHLVDTHTHIFGQDFDSDRNEMIARAHRAGVDWMLLPNIDTDTVDQVKAACQLDHTLKPMWGLHPCHVGSDWKERLGLIQPWLDKFPPVAIGEIGLDFYWSKEFISEQKACLEMQLDWALQYNLPVSLHTREATEETIAIVASKPGLKGVFHCFSGTEAQANTILEMGLLLGIGGSITYKKNELRNFIKTLPAEGLVLETDAPYLPPVPYRGKRNEPAYLVEICYELAGLMEMAPGKLAEITTRNAETLFHLGN